jgi:hypothetical protein
MTFTVLLPYVTTPITSLAREMTIDVNTSFSEQTKLVLSEHQELSWTPVTEFACSTGFLSTSSPHFHSCYVKFLKGNSITVAIGDCFAYDVVGISDEPSLSTAQTNKMSFGASSACSLKSTTQESVASLDLPKLFSIEETGIACYSGIDESSVNTENTFDFTKLGFFYIELNIKEDLSFFAPECSGSAFGNVVFIFDESWNDELVFSSSSNGAYSNFAVIEVRFEGVVIETNSTNESLDWSLLQFESLEHITRLVAYSGNETAIEFRIFLPDLFVGCVVELGLVEGLEFESFVDDVLTSTVRSTQRSEESFVWVLDSRAYREFHKPLKHNTYKYLSPGSEWTKKYRPVRVISVEEGTLSDEGKVTAKYIEKFGVNNVRGGWFNYSGEDESVILACYGRRTNW